MNLPSLSSWPLLPELLGHGARDWGVVVVFATVYLGMFLGGLPRLKLDRSGVALLGAIAMLGLGALSAEQAVLAVDWPTVLLLFAFMVLAAQMALGGFFAAVTRRVAAAPLSRRGLLAVLIGVAAGLSAVFSNDVVALAMTPMVARLCLRRGYAPVPFLVGLACAVNIGSAATLIGNPQNMLIGSVMALHFADYTRQALVPVGLALLLLWGWLAWGPSSTTPALLAGADRPDLTACAPAVDDGVGEPALDRWQAGKGLVVSLSLLLVFLLTGWPREVAALLGAGVLLLSRRLHSAQVMRVVDWGLLVLFMGLFVVNHAFQATGLASQAVAWLAAHGVVMADPGPLFVLGLALSNLVSNVPTVMLMLPHLGSGAAGQQAATWLALVCTFAGNLLLVGSIANLIVADLAKQQGIAIGWREHAAIAMPVTLASLAILWWWI